MRLLLAILLTCVSCRASTYYVATNGSNGNSGTSSGSPWLTISKAVTNAVAGDTVNIGAGIFNEYISHGNSGTSGNPITFQGTRGSGGEWLTIIDPSTALTNGWTASALGPFLYENTNVTFEVNELTINHQKVPFLYTTNYTTDFGGWSANTFPYTNGIQILTMPTNVTAGLGGQTNEMWPVLRALWASKTNIVWLRMWDGSDPNGLDIRVANNFDGTKMFNVRHGAIQAIGKSFITWKDVHVRGAYGQFYFDTGAHDLTVSGCKATTGSSRFFIENDCYNITITNCTMTTDFYGYQDPGAWIGGGVTNWWQREVLYTFDKYWMGQASTLDHDVRMWVCAGSNTVANCTMTKGIGSAINIASTPGFAVADRPMISGNTIQGYPSVGIQVSQRTINELIYDNSLADCDGNIRFNELNYVGDTNRTVWIYRNRLWNPQSTGDQMFFHLNFTAATNSYHPYMQVYHNSFQGGRATITLSQYFGANGGHPHLYFFNNAVSASQYYLSGGGTTTTSTLIGGHDYNYFGDGRVGGLPGWYGSHNITNSAVVWPTNSVPDFLLPASHGAIDAAIDSTSSFSIDVNGSGLAAMPQNNASKVGSAWDIGALEYAPPPSAPTGPGKTKRNGLGGVKGFGR